MMQKLALLTAGAMLAGAAAVKLEQLEGPSGLRSGPIFGCFWAEQHGAAGSTLRLRMRLPNTEQACDSAPLDGLPGAILPNPTPDPKRIAVALTGQPGQNETLVAGNIEIVLTSQGFHIYRRSDRRLLTALMRLQAGETMEPGYDTFNMSLQAFPGERIWGLGETAIPRSGGRKLNNRGSAIDFRKDQSNTHITIQHAVSSREYGTFLNHPGWGCVDMTADDYTVWSVSMAKQLDFLFTTSEAPAPAAAAAAATAITDSASLENAVGAASTAAAATARGGGGPYHDIMKGYYDAIGHAPPLPDWALGFWASKERYSSQAEIVEVVTNYTEIHGINVSVLVIDWKTYACVGDWAFTLNKEVCWPDPKEMVSKLKALGVNEVMISLHPWAEPGSPSFAEMREQGLCLSYPNKTAVEWGGWGLPSTCNASGEEPAGLGNCLYDPSNPKAREYLWSKLKTSYYDQGITQFWTDGTEPAGAPKNGLPVDIAFHGGIPGNASWMMWPVWHSQTAYEGAIAAGGQPGWSLARSAWAGSHLHNTIVWSGDISSTWQVRGGLNMQLVYPYWNSDTGGFHSGNTSDPIRSGFAELQARWFQFSIFCSITRLHGDRNAHEAPHTVPLQEQCDPTHAAGGPIEPWVLGQEAYLAVKSALSLRATLIDYLKAQVALLAKEGTPVMRPLWFDFATDDAAQAVEDQFMFGADYMVAPVLQSISSSTTREVYFPSCKPAGTCSFKHYFTGAVYEQGSTKSVPLGEQLDEFPLFIVKRA